MVWLVEYIEEHLSNDKSWHISNAIKEFAKNILSEVYQEKGDDLRAQIDANGGAFLTEYREKLISKEQEILKEAERCADKFFKLAKDAGLKCDDFYQKKSGVWGFFTKVKNGEFPKPNSYVNTCITSPEKLTKKPLSDSQRSEII